MVKGTVGPRAWETQALWTKWLSKHQEHPNWYENVKKPSFKYIYLKLDFILVMIQWRIPQLHFPFDLKYEEQRQG